MLEEAYYFGLTPKEAEQLTAGEMASFIKANRKRELEQNKVNASIGYATGVLASMSLSKRRPRFSEVFNFPKDEDERFNVEQHKAQMLVWAERTNRLSRKENKSGRKRKH